MEPLSLPLGREWRKAPAFRRGRATSPSRRSRELSTWFHAPLRKALLSSTPSPDEGEKSLSPVRLCLTPPL